MNSILSYISFFRLYNNFLFLFSCELIIKDKKIKRKYKVDKRVKKDVVEFLFVFY